MTPKNSTIHHGDCMEVMRNMSTGSVDVVFTSPPYNLARSRNRPKGDRNHLDGGKTRTTKLRNGYDAYSDDMIYEEYVRWQKSVLLECWRLLKPPGAIFYNHKPRLQLGYLYTPLDLNPGLPVRNVIIWNRSSGPNATPRAFASNCEWVVVFAKPDFKLRDRAASMIGDVWSFGPERHNPHPAPFPVELPLKALESLPASMGIVLDPFCGSGTTGVACLATGRKFIGIEIDKGYAEMSRRRLYSAEQGDFESWQLAGA